MKIRVLLVAAAILCLPLVTKATTHNSRVCSAAKKAGLASCQAHVVTDMNNNPLTYSAPQGYGPAQFLGAYNLKGIIKSKQIIAIVDAYDDPKIKNDLDVYSKQFNLPILPLCNGLINNAKSPCFQKINQRGIKNFPAQNGGWSLEMALDVETAHAICQNCSILLVEADSPNMKNLMAAVDQAVKQGANEVSNSWGGPEFAGETNFDKHFNFPGTAFTVSAGDNGFGTEYPAASPYVTSVGGTSLTMKTGNSYGGEDAWSDSGSGCSRYEHKPAWQTDNKCPNRTIADVSADADPATGAAIYSSLGPKSKKGWFKVGGTSLSAPLIAGVYALSDNLPNNQKTNSLPYALGSRSNLHDVVGGSNGYCDPSYLCNGKTKYDGPTGLGSPNGIGAF